MCLKPLLSQAFTVCFFSFLSFSACAGKLTPFSSEKDSEKQDFQAIIPEYKQEGPIRGMWLSFPFWNLSLEKKKIFVEYLANHKINKVYLSVYDNGIVRWPSQSLLEAGFARAEDAKITNTHFINTVNLFRKNKIEVVAFFEGGLSAHLDQPFVQKHPELLQKCNNGYRSGEHGGHLMAFIDPQAEQARTVILNALEELARHPVGFTEIQLDRFRFTRGEEWEICLSADGKNNPQYINRLVQDAYNKIKAINPKIKVSASPVGSYGFWKLNQRWGDWVKGGYIDEIVTQAYIPPSHLEQCARGNRAKTPERLQNLAIFDGEMASVLGKPQALENAVARLKGAGGNIAELELEKRRPMTQVRFNDWQRRNWKFPDKKVKVIGGVMAHEFDDSECIYDQLEHLNKLGITDHVLWVSEVSPSENGLPYPGIHDNLSLLSETLWK